MKGNHKSQAFYFGLLVGAVTAYLVFIVVGYGPAISRTEKPRQVVTIENKNAKITEPNPVKARAGKLAKSSPEGSAITEVPSFIPSRQILEDGDTDKKAENDYAMFGVNGPRETTWLREHYFPANQKVIDRYATAGMKELQELASHGDLLAQTEIGKRLMSLGQYYQGQQQLIEAASKGSIYSIHELANMSMGSVSDNVPRNPIDVLAWRTVAYMRGDWTSLNFVPGTASLNPKQRMLAFALAASYYREIANRHIHRTGRPFETR